MSGSGAEVADVEVVDLVFELRGRAVAEDYADMLWAGLRAALPWLEAEAVAAVHPLAWTSPGEGERYLSKRSRLMLRLAADRVEQARALTGTRFDLGSEVEVGAAKLRTLAPAKVLYSSFVQVGLPDEGAFLAECRRLLDELGVKGEMVAGKAQSMRTTSGCLQGFSLMLHGLGADESLHLQCLGLGAERKRGCGVFVPHKSVVAVGEI